MLVSNLFILQYFPFFLVVQAASRVVFKPIAENLRKEINQASKEIEEEVVQTIEEFRRRLIQNLI